MSRNDILKTNGIAMIVDKENKTRTFIKGDILKEFGIHANIPLYTIEKYFGKLIDRDRWD